MLYYNKIEQLELVIDARAVGNEARYIQRSCMPNSEVRVNFQVELDRLFYHYSSTNFEFDSNLFTEYVLCLGKSKAYLAEDVSNYKN